jgi:hypothetical protein
MHLPLALWIVLGIIGFIIFVGLPVGALYQQWKIKKESETHQIGLIIHRNGVTFHFVKMLRDRETCIDSTKTANNPEGVPIPYYTKEGYSPRGLWPPDINKFFQAFFPLTVWVEKNVQPVDLLKDFRETPVTSINCSVQQSNMRREKITGEVVRHGEDIAELRKQLDEARKGSRSALWIFLVGGVLLVAMMVTFYMLKSSNSDILEQLQILNHGLFGNITP